MKDQSLQKINEQIDYTIKLSNTGFPKESTIESTNPTSGFIFSSKVSVVTEEGHVDKGHTENFDKSATFFQNLKYWKKETCFRSTKIHDSPYFRHIVDMGTEAVPFIVHELKKGPSHLVHALDLIFPNVVRYEGFVCLEDACNTWVEILSPLFESPSKE